MAHLLGFRRGASGSMSPGRRPTRWRAKTPARATMRVEDSTTGGGSLLTRMLA